MTRRLALWSPVAAWMALLFGASAQTGSTAASIPLPDWSTHGVAYLVLGVLVCRALSDGFRLAVGWRVALVAVAISTLYGVSDEWHQSFVPGRQASFSDVLKDLGGSAVGAGLCVALAGRARRPQRPARA